MEFETIVSLATPPGDGAIGIIRMSGRDSLDILNRIFIGKGKAMKSRMMTYGHIMDGDRTVDEVMAVYFEGPFTYTREDVVEIHSHGSSVSIYSIIKLILANGARVAEPGEFTKRAFLNGRLDLSQAEAVMDVVSSKTENSLGIALDQLGGSLSSRVAEMRSDLIDILGNLEVSIDYPEEDIEEITYEKVESSLANVRGKIERTLENSQSGRIMREGISIVIAGRPNVGKSSLLNRLLRESRAIVTDIPGTTRDVIEEYLSIKGVPVKVIDTAGIRETDDVVERIGVEKTRQSLEGANLVILVLNGSEGIMAEDMDIIESIGDRNTIVLINKIDIECSITEDDIRSSIPHERTIFTSMKRDDAIEELEDAIFDMISEGSFRSPGSGDTIAVSNARHIDLLRKSSSSISDALTGVSDRMPYDFLQVDIKDAYDSLGEITGETASESLLNNIFSRFCLGK